MSGEKCLGVVETKEDKQMRMYYEITNMLKNGQLREENLSLKIRGFIDITEADIMDKIERQIEWISNM